jgi:large subunit ribosomal protein L18
MVKKQRKLDKKRRREGKTNYTKRLILLKGNFPRLVVRKSNKYITLQIIESSHAQDKVIYTVNTRELLKQGWPEDKKGSLKSLAASYLGGLLLGKKAKELKQEVILDSGLIPNTPSSRIYAAVKGFADSGIKIKFNENVVPSEERIKSNYEFFEKMKGEINK